MCRETCWRGRGGSGRRNEVRPNALGLNRFSHSPAQSLVNEGCKCYRTGTEGCKCEECESDRAKGDLFRLQPQPKPLCQLVEHDVPAFRAEILAEEGGLSMLLNPASTSACARWTCAGFVAARKDAARSTGGRTLARGEAGATGAKGMDWVEAEARCGKVGGRAYGVRDEPGAKPPGLSEGVGAGVARWANEKLPPCFSPKSVVKPEVCGASDSALRFCGVGEGAETLELLRRHSHLLRSELCQRRSSDASERSTHLVIVGSILRFVVCRVLRLRILARRLSRVCHLATAFALLAHKWTHAQCFARELHPDSSAPGRVLDDARIAVVVVLKVRALGVDEPSADLRVQLEAHAKVTPAARVTVVVAVVSVAVDVRPGLVGALDAR